MTYYHSVPNKHYKGLNVTLQVVRSISASQQASVKLFNGRRGNLKGSYFVQDIKIEDEVYSIIKPLTEILEQIKTVAIADTVVAKRKTEEARLLTTGFGWRDYAGYLPEKYRPTKTKKAKI